MLSKEAAQKLLLQWRATPEHPDDSEAQPRSRFLPRYFKLPKKLRRIACGLCGADETGEALAKAVGPDAYPRMAARLQQEFLECSAAEQVQLLKIPFPRMAEDLVRALAWVETTPYQNGYERKAFRAINRPELAVSRKAMLLGTLLRTAELYREDALTPEWYAVWAPHVHVSWQSIETQVIPLLASAIDAGGPTGEKVFDVLLQCGSNEHEHGGMGRHVVGALLGASRLEGWEFVEKMLLAAQRQEGLRQVILEAVDLAHPEAFARLLQVIEEENLVRFSAVTRALNVWLGYAWDSESAKVVNQTVSRIRLLLNDSAARDRAVAGDDAEAAYLALWATALVDAESSVVQASRMIRAGQAEVRFAATVHLCNLQWPQQTLQPLKIALEDEDLRIACHAAAHMRSCDDDDDDPQDPKSGDLFERLERLVSRLPHKPEAPPPLVWPWAQIKLDRSQVASILATTLNDRPFSRLVPYLPMLDTWQRAQMVSKLAKQDQWTPELREMAVRLAGDSSAQVRGAAIEALGRHKLTEDECLRLEGLLTRKAADLRTGVLSLLKRLPDENALASADRLLASKQAAQRLAGLELVRELKEQERCVSQCQGRAAEFRERHRKVSKDEEMHLGLIEARESLTAGLSLANGLGLLNPENLTRGRPPRSRRCEFWTPAAEAGLKSLDALVHEHRETPVTVYRQSVLLGTVTWGFPHPRSGKQALRELPLRELWQGWLINRPKKLRDRDGLELLRAHLAAEFVSGYRHQEQIGWIKGSSTRTGMGKLLKFSVPRFRYPALTRTLLGWCLVLEPPADAVGYLADCLETLCAQVPAAELEALDPARAKPKPRPDHYYHSGNREHEDWRHDSPVNHWHNALTQAIHAIEPSPDQIQRIWPLLCWFDRPVPQAMRALPPEKLLMQAYLQRQATLDDIADNIIGPREPSNYGWKFSLLRTFSSRRPDRYYADFLKRCPEVQKLVDDIRARILDIELPRGDTPTVATDAARELASLNGAKTLRRLLQALGKNQFKVVPAYGGAKHTADVFSHLAAVTFPDDDDAESFTPLMKQAVAAKEFPEERLIQLAFLAPQWVKHIEAYLRWPGMSEGVYWFLAHMGFLWGSNVAEKAAEGAGLMEADDDATSTSSDDSQVDAVEADEAGDSEPSEAGAAAPQLSPWQRLILERTPLSATEREAGAIDVSWFHRVYQVLGEKRWQQLAQAARFASTPAQAKKARTIAEVLLGQADLQALIDGIEQRQLKDNVRLLGLFPLPGGAKRDAELRRRFDILQAYQRYARGLSGLTKPQALQALDIGLKNLAATAGYADPLRLEWALGADELKDLAQGSVAATVEGVTVTLKLDEAAQPALSVVRGDKPLKSAPAAVKKDPRVADLFHRCKEIKRKASRLRAALEQCMCRGDTFSSKELQSLMSHPLVAPLLARLVLVGEGIAGYPDRNGKALRDYAGKLEPVKKSELLRIAHPYDLFVAKNWSDWQRDCFRAERIQPFKQVFRELYVPTKQELSDRDASHRYAGQQVNPRQAHGLWGNRGWNTGDGVFKTLHELGLTVVVEFDHGITTPLEVEGLTIDAIRFSQRRLERTEQLALKDVPPRAFSEVMRDCDLVVSVAHRGGVDPEASAGTVEMRASLIRETAELMGLKNVRMKANQALIDGQLANYSVHLGSGTVHRLPGGAVCIVPVHAQHRGRLFLPFADDDPRSAEVLSKVLLLARDQEIQDPSILEQLRA